MKKAFLLITMSVSAFLVKAQKYEDIKNKLILSMYKPAKEELDKAMTNAKFTSKAEAYILKTTVYAGMAMTDAVKNTPEAVTLLTEAETSFKKYREMEPEMTLLSDPIYQNGPFQLYSGYYAAGYKEYTAKNWQASFDKFKKATEMSDILISKKIITSSLDTTILILAGITADNSNNKDAAAMYYQRLADNKITGDDYENTVYRFLVRYYFQKNDFPSFEKYKALGHQLFPESEFFTYDKIDFGVGLATSFDAKLKALEDVLVTDSNNYKANKTLGEIIYDTLNSRYENAILPANAIELETKMLNAFRKTAVVEKPESGEIHFSNVHIGNHYMIKAATLTEEINKHTKEMNSRTKPGSMASKEDLAKRDLLHKKFMDALEKAQVPYEKAAALYALKPVHQNKTQAMRDKKIYKSVVNYLAEIFENKKINAKGKPADQAKFAAEEKKWSDLYNTIK